MATVIVELTEAEKQALTDQLIRIVAQVPQIVGTEINWTQLIADSIIEVFQTKGVHGDAAIWPSEIDELIEKFLTPESKGKSYTAARKIIFELAHFLDKRDAAPEATAQIPSDETHEFAVVARVEFERGRFTVGETFTEVEAVQWVADFTRITGNSDAYMILARPKTEPWKVIDYSN